MHFLFSCLLPLIVTASFVPIPRDSLASSGLQAEPIDVSDEPSAHSVYLDWDPSIYYDSKYNPVSRDWFKTCEASRIGLCSLLKGHLHLLYDTWYYNKAAPACKVGFYVGSKASPPTYDDCNKSILPAMIKAIGNQLTQNATTVYNTATVNLAAEHFPQAGSPDPVLNAAFPPSQGTQIDPESPSWIVQG